MKTNALVYNRLHKLVSSEVFFVNTLSFKGGGNFVKDGHHGVRVIPWLLAEMY